MDDSEKGPSTILCQGRANGGYPGPPRPSYDSGACGTHEPAGPRTSSNSARRQGTCGRRRRVRRVRCPCSGTGVGGVLRAQRRSVQGTSSRFRPTLEYGNTRHAIGPIPVRMTLFSAPGRTGAALHHSMPGACEWRLPGATRHGPPTIQARAELTSRPVRVPLPTAHADGVLAVVAAVYVELDVRVLAQTLVVCSELNGAAFRT